MMVLKRSLVKDFLDANVAGDFDAATVHLFKNDFAPNPDMVIGDFVEATYTGYAAIPIPAWGLDYRDDLGNDVNLANPVQFVGPSDSVPQVIYGYYIRSAGGGTPLLSAERFVDGPLSMNLPTDLLTIDAQLAFGPTLMGGVAEVTRN